MERGLQTDNLTAGFWVGDWLAEPLLNRISRDGEDVAVEPKVMEVLVRLAQQPGRTLTKDFFFETVWDGMVVTEDVLTRCISELRRNLGDDSRDPRYVETIRKTGYRLIAPVVSREADAVPDQRRRQPRTDPGNPRVESITNTPPPPSARSDLSGFITQRQAATVVALIVLVAAYLLYSRLGNPPAARPVATSVPFTSLPGLEIDPAFSPDGLKIAFASDDNGQRNFDIYIKQEGSDKALRITENAADERYPAWSPDGLFLAFVRATAGSTAVYMVPSLGGQERRLADFGSRRVQGVSWSPDGRQLAVSAQREPFGAFSIFMVKVDSATVRRITSPPQNDYGDVTPSYSPDGRFIAFARGISEDVQDVFVYLIEREEPKQITFDSSSISGLDWSPDAESIVFGSHRNQTSGIWRVDLAGGEPQSLASAGPSATFEYPSVAKDGQRISYVHSIANVNIWRLFKPDGFPSLRARPAVFSTHWDSHPDISPIGDRIAFASTQSGSREIWVSDADGGNPAQITLEGGRARGPRWSPDAKELAFQWRRHGQADVYLVSVEGGPPRRLTKSLFEDTVPSWSRDGTSVYFSSNRTGRWELWRMPKIGGQPEQVTRYGGRFGMESADGQSIFFVRPDTCGIWHRRLDSLERPNLVYSELDIQDWGNWSVAPSGIYFVQRQPHAPALSFYGFESKLTTRLQTLDRVPAHPSLAVSQDFAWFLYTQIDDEGSDIMVLEGFE